MLINSFAVYLFDLLLMFDYDCVIFGQYKRVVRIEHEDLFHLLIKIVSGYIFDGVDCL